MKRREYRYRKLRRSLRRFDFGPAFPLFLLALVLTAGMWILQNVH